MIQKEVIHATGLSHCMVSHLSLKYNLGVSKGKRRIYSEEDVNILKLLAHYRKYRKDIIQMFRALKRYNGCRDSELKQHLPNLSYYRYNIALTELSFLSYLWEENNIENGEKNPKYYIEGEFFEKYLDLLRSSEDDKSCKHIPQFPEMEAFL